MLKRKQDNKDATLVKRSSTLKKDIDRNLAYKREVARLRAEDQQEFRENEAQIQEMRRYQILEKHLNMQQKLECK